MYFPNGIGLVLTQREVTICRLLAHSLNSYRSNNFDVTGLSKQLKKLISAVFSPVRYFQPSVMNSLRITAIQQVM